MKLNEQKNNNRPPKDKQNAISHDIWRTIGFSIASVALNAVSWLKSKRTTIEHQQPQGSGVAHVRDDLAVTYHEASVCKIKDY